MIQLTENAKNYLSSIAKDDYITQTSPPSDVVNAEVEKT